MASRRLQEEDPVDMTQSTDHNAVLPPPPLPFSAKPPRILIIGAGSRGRTYARAIQSSCNGKVVAVAEPDAYKRRQFGRTFLAPNLIPTRDKNAVADGDESENDAVQRLLPEGSMFKDWRDFISWETSRREQERACEQNQNSNTVPEGVDAVFICVLDEQHHDAVLGLAPLGLHMMCEKPLATRLSDCVAMYRAMSQHSRNSVFSIGHVLRYSPHNIVMRRLLLGDRAIGDILSVVHTEPVGWWHFAHSYVRGNWRRESTTAPSLLTKSCHDIDILLWLLCSPPPGADPNTLPHLPRKISSSGALQYFRKARKPRTAGDATNCLACPIEKECMYSSKRIYVGPLHQGLETGNTHWPVSIVVPDIESCETGDARKAALMRVLAEDYDTKTPEKEIRRRNWFGRCVYESDNDVCDEQTVTLTWDDDPLPTSTDSEGTSEDKSQDSLGGRGAKQATFHMIAQTKRQCDRYTYVYGTRGELYADSRTITIEDFQTGETYVHEPRLESRGHGGGDVGLARQFVLAVDQVKNGGWTAERAQRETVGCSLEDILRSHAVVFAAEEARGKGNVVDWAEWWGEVVGDV